MEGDMSGQSAPGTATLTFDTSHLAVGGAKDLRAGLSAVAAHGDHLWLACDEGARLERLTQRGSSSTLVFDTHSPMELSGVVDLQAGPDEEADIEGMDVDDGYVWLISSHSVKRKKADADDNPAKVARKLADISRDGNRYLLARVPIAPDGSIARRAGSKQAGTIPATQKSSALLDAILEAKDPHLAPFVEIPGKDNGFDIEGLAVRGTQVLVGLRGPVLRGWCCLVELRLDAEGSTLHLTPLDGAVRYRKHFLNLGGLGVRDLLWLGDDLLILAGPTMALDGACEIWRWTNVGADTPPTVTRLRSLPHTEGVDRAEGFTLLEGAGAPRALVVYDTPAGKRLDTSGGVTADVFTL
jgi:hypothetical protein